MSVTFLFVFFFHIFIFIFFWTPHWTFKTLLLMCVLYSISYFYSILFHLQNTSTKSTMYKRTLDEHTSISKKVYKKFKAHVHGCSIVFTRIKERNEMFTWRTHASSMTFLICRRSTKNNNQNQKHYYIHVWL